MPLHCTIPFPGDVVVRGKGADTARDLPGYALCVGCVRALTAEGGGVDGTLATLGDLIESEIDGGEVPAKGGARVDLPGVFGIGSLSAYCMVRDC